MIQLKRDVCITAINAPVAVTLKHEITVLSIFVTLLEVFQRCAFLSSRDDFTLNPAVKPDAVYQLEKFFKNDIHGAALLI